MYYPTQTFQCKEFRCGEELQGSDAKGLIDTWKAHMSEKHPVEYEKTPYVVENRIIAEIEGLFSAT